LSLSDAADAIAPAERVAATAGLDLLVAVDHREARIYAIDVSHAARAEHIIKPYDPHHILHHLSHKDHAQEGGQRSPEDASFYKRIAEAIAGASRIVLVGHASGKSNAAIHLMHTLTQHHPDIARHVVRELVADLPRLTEPQLLDLARQALHSQQLS
jgi:hypothetical protein